MSDDLFSMWNGGINWSALPGLTPRAYIEDGKPVAIAVMAGSEIHFAIAPEHRCRLIQRQRTREFLAPLFDRFGFLTTTVQFGDQRERFVRRLGFVPTWDEGDRRHFMLTELPFSKHQENH